MLPRKATIFFHPLNKYAPAVREEDFFNHCMEEGISLSHIVRVQNEEDFDEFHELIKAVYDNDETVTIFIDDDVHIYEKKMISRRPL